MKTLLPAVSWISGTIAAILVLFGIISFLFNCSLFGISHGINFFHAANSFFLLSICCLIDKKVTEDKKK